MKVHAYVPFGSVGLLREPPGYATAAASEIDDKPVAIGVHVGENWPPRMVFERCRIDGSNKFSQLGGRNGKIV